MGADREERRGVKAGFDKDDCRKNRANQKVELRKAKRDEGLQKRRNMQMVSVEPSEVDIADPATPEGPATQSFEAQIATALAFVARNGPAEEYDAALVAVRGLRKQLSLARNPPIDDCINAGLVPAFVTMLGHPESKLQFEAAWCLTNIASGNSKQCETVVQNNGVPPLVALMGSSVMDVCEQAVWAIGNIAGDCPAMRDIVLANGATERVLKMIEVCALMLPPPECMVRVTSTSPHLPHLGAPPSPHLPLLVCAGDGLNGSDGPSSQRHVGSVQPDAWQAPARRWPRVVGGAHAGQASDDCR